MVVLNAMFALLIAPLWAKALIAAYFWNLCVDGTKPKEEDI
jgi:hypothetical protein